MGYTERAFGDSMSRWGTPTVLLETGGWHGPGEAERLVRLNFVVLLSALHALARGEEALDGARPTKRSRCNVQGPPRRPRPARRDGPRRAGAFPRSTRTSPSSGRGAFAGDGQRLAAPRSSRTWATSTTSAASRRSTRRISSSLPRPPAAPPAGRRPLASLAARGLAKDGLLLLDDAALAREAKAWAAGRAITPWTAVDLVLFRRTEKGLAVDGFVRDGVRGR